MFEFTEKERAFLSEMHAITTDGSGREVLVGLTADETTTYMTLTRKFASQPLRPDENEVYLSLHDKHESARIAVLAAENVLRVDKPPRH